MKKIAIVLCIAFMTILTLSFYSNTKSGITGVIDPANGAKKVWAIGGTDSTSVIPLGGKFSIDVKPGNYKVVVEAIAPYKNAVVEGVLVLETQATDVGTIKLPND